MNMLRTAAFAMSALVASVSAPAMAQTLDAGDGDGYIEFFAPPGYFYTLYGNDNGVDGVVTTFSAVAAADFTESFIWRYQTFDEDGANFDPAGYFIDDQFFQLSNDDLDFGEFETGTITITVLAGQTFGAYVGSTDGSFGRGQISFGAGAGGIVPEPATWAMMIGGIGAAGGALRRRKANVSVTFA